MQNLDKSTVLQSPLYNGNIMPSLMEDYEKIAIIIIDIQKGIINMNRELNPYSGDKIVENNVKLVNRLRESGCLITFVHVDFLDGKDALKPVMDESGDSMNNYPDDFAEFLPELSPNSSDLVITKRQWGAFFGTELDLQLRRRRIDTLLLTGVATSIGVDTTAREAFQRDYQQIFVEDAMTDLTNERHQFVTQKIFPRMGRIRSTADVIQELK